MRYRIPEHCVVNADTGERECDLDIANARWEVVCTRRSGEGNQTQGPPDPLDIGGVLSGGIATNPRAGGGRRGECERIVEFIRSKIARFEEKFRKYNPVTDYYGEVDYFLRGGVRGTTKANSHYNNLLDARRGIANKIAEWEKICKDRFGGPPLIPLPDGAEEVAVRHIEPPRPFRILDILPAPPTNKQIEELYRQRTPLLPILPRRILVF